MDGKRLPKEEETRFYGTLMTFGLLGLLFFFFFFFFFFFEKRLLGLLLWMKEMKLVL